MRRALHFWMISLGTVSLNARHDSYMQLSDINWSNIMDDGLSGVL